jgi:hypothetical protein
MSRAPKRRPVEDPRQIALQFEAPPRADASPGALAGLDRRISGLVGRILKEEDRPREVIAGAMSALLGEDVTKAVLDQYAAPSADAHNISAARFVALVAVTARHDLLDMIAQLIGARVLVGEEFYAARLGSLQAERRRLDGQIRDLERLATPIRGAR